MIHQHLTTCSFGSSYAKSNMHWPIENSSEEAVDVWELLHVSLAHAGFRIPLWLIQVCYVSPCTGIWPMDLNFPMFSMGVRIFRASNDVGPLLESERIQNRPPLWLTIGHGNRSSGVYMKNSTNTTVNQWHDSWWGPTKLVHSIRLFFRNQGNRQ